MQITSVRIEKIEEKPTSTFEVKAVATIILDDEFCIHDIKIAEGKAGRFIIMPNKKTSKGEFKDIAHPIVSDTREKIKTAIFEEYDKLI